MVGGCMQDKWLWYKSWLIVRWEYFKFFVKNPMMFWKWFKLKNKGNNDG